MYNIDWPSTILTIAFCVIVSLSGVGIILGWTLVLMWGFRDHLTQAISRLLYRFR